MRLFDLSFEPLGAASCEDTTAHVFLQEQHPRDLLSDRARAADDDGRWPGRVWW